MAAGEHAELGVSSYGLSSQASSLVVTGAFTQVACVDAATASHAVLVVMPGTDSQLASS